jgi:hypothetical protein
MNLEKLDHSAWSQMPPRTPTKLRQGQRSRSGQQMLQSPGSSLELGSALAGVVMFGARSASPPAVLFSPLKGKSSRSADELYFGGLIKLSIVEPSLPAIPERFPRTKSIAQRSAAASMRAIQLRGTVTMTEHARPKEELTHHARGALMARAEAASVSQCFQEFDSNADGKILQSELKTGLENLLHLTVTQQQARGVYNSMQCDGKIGIDFREFSRFITGPDACPGVYHRGIAPGGVAHAYKPGTPLLHGTGEPLTKWASPIPRKKHLYTGLPSGPSELDTTRRTQLDRDMSWRLYA